MRIHLSSPNGRTPSEANFSGQRGTPKTTKTYNGSGVISKVRDRGAYDLGVELDLSRPCTPTRNSSLESFNGKFRGECLSLEWFRSRRKAAAIIEAWRRHYNVVRPHSSLNYMTPHEFKQHNPVHPNRAVLQK